MLLNSVHMRCFEERNEIRCFSWARLAGKAKIDLLLPSSWLHYPSTFLDHSGSHWILPWGGWTHQKNNPEGGRGKNKTKQGTTTQASSKQASRTGSQQRWEAPQLEAGRGRTTQQRVGREENKTSPCFLDTGLQHHKLKDIYFKNYRMTYQSFSSKSNGVIWLT